MAKEAIELMRAFICIDLSEELAEKITQATADIGRDIRLVPKAQLHITLFFFDGITKPQANAVASLLKGMKFKGFEVYLRHPGAFNIKHPNVVFIEVESKGLEALYAKLKPLIEAQHIRVEQRPYKPHLTIGRDRRAGRRTKNDILEFLEEHIEEEFGSFHCGEVKLMKSKLTPEGPIHELLYSKPLET